MTQSGLFLGLLTPLLVLVGVIDARTGRIPNVVNAGIAALGLAQALAAGTAVALERLADAAILGLGLLLLRHLHARWRGRIGFGLGDVKFLAAATLWLGLAGVPAMILLACLSALAAVAVLRFRGARIGGDTALRFGPHLAAALFLVLLAGLLIS